MVTLTDFVIALLTSVLELVVTFADMVLSDPLATVSFLFGNVFILLAIGAFAYVVLGAFSAELGIIGVDSSSGRLPQRERSLPRGRD